MARYSRPTRPDSPVTFEEAAFTTLGAVALHGVRTADVKLGDVVAVIGLGLLGQLTVQILKAAGCRVLGMDIAQERADLALRLGADEVCVSRDGLHDLCLQNSNGSGADAVLITAETTSSEPVNVAPQITSFDPNPIMVGVSNTTLTINGSGFGSSPTVTLPAGITSTGQGSTDSQIILQGVSVDLNATIGNNNVTVTAGGQTSAPASLTIDGPYHMVVQSDATGLCSGCRSTVMRTVTYQVQNFSGTPASTTWMGENISVTGWSCSQSNPGITTAPCSNNFKTNTAGVFSDQWSLGADGYTPAGCGDNVMDHWQWCAHSPTQTLGTLTGYTHTNAISINGTVSPNSMPPGTVVPF